MPSLVTVHVTRHAAEQARNRRMYQDGDVEELIADDVRAALDGRRRSNRKPKAFRLWRERKKGGGGGRTWHPLD